MLRQLLYGLTALFLLLPAVFGPQDRSLVRKFLCCAPMAFLGLVSYGVYLWHEAWIGQVFSWFGYTLFDAPIIPVVLVGGALTVATASLSYYLVERPILRFKDRPPWRPPAPEAHRSRRAVVTRPEAARPEAGLESVPAHPADRGLPVVANRAHFPGLDGLRAIAAVMVDLHPRRRRDRLVLEHVPRRVLRADGRRCRRLLRAVGVPALPAVRRRALRRYAAARAAAVLVAPLPAHRARVLARPHLLHRHRDHPGTGVGPHRVSLRLRPDLLEGARARRSRPGVDPLRRNHLLSLLAHLCDRAAQVAAAHHEPLACRVVRGRACSG